MNRYPFLTLFFFVGLSMAIAVGYSSYQQSDLEAKIDGQESFAKAQSFSTEAKNMVRELANASEVGTDEIKSCQCVPKGRRIKGYLVHEKESCAKETLAYQVEFEKMPALFRERRASSAAEFPRICMVRILNSVEQSALTDKKCAHHAPICVTEEYVNVVYNLYADVFSCFDLPQKEILPWFQVNGGFHLNAKNGVSGLKISAVEAEKYFQQALNQLTKSSEPSCQRLLPYAQKMNLDSTDDCFQIAPPQNPMLSFLIFAQKYQQSKKMMQSALLRETNLRFDIDQEHLLQILTLQVLNQNPEQLIAGVRQFSRQPASETYIQFSKNQKDDLLEKMSQAAKVLNRDFKEGTCASDSLLSP